MKKQIYDEKNGLSYTLHGDYYLPDLVINEEMLMEQMAEQWDVTEELKTQNQMEWMQRMNNIKTNAEEVVLKENIYL